MKHLVWIAAISLCVLSASSSPIPLAAQTSTAPPQPASPAKPASPSAFGPSFWSQPAPDSKSGANPWTRSSTFNVAPGLSSQGPSNCPISMHASQIGGGATVMVDNEGHRHPISHGLHLSLTDSQHTATIVSAQVTVHGLNGKPHTVQSGPLFRMDGIGGGNPWETARLLTLHFTRGEDHRAEAELSAAGFSSVSWIQIDSLTFSDGSLWIPPLAASCRTTPDPFMLVSGK